MQFLATAIPTRWTHVVKMQGGGRHFCFFANLYRLVVQ